MTFANVNIGSYAGDNTGDPLRTAFDKINRNFANITSGNVSVTLNAPVMSVAGRTGNIVLNVNDVSGAVGLGRLTSTVNAANIAANAYTDAAISNLVNGAPLALDTLVELAEQLSDDTSAITAITNSLNQTTNNQNAANVLVYALDARVSSVELVNNAQAVSLNTLTTNAASQSLEINRINANVTAANVAISSLQNDVNDHAEILDTLTANAATQSYNLFVLSGNAAMQHGYISELRANITAANAVIAQHTASIDSLLSNAASQSNDISTLIANAAVQANSLTDLVANAASQSNSLTTLTANAATQSTALTDLTANAASQAGELNSLVSNAASQATSLTTLTANASAQAESLTTLFGNAIAQAESLTALVGNAVTQAESINSINGNVTAANLAIQSVTTAWTANAATQATAIDTLTANAASQATAINTLTANAATQSNAISTINNTIDAINQTVADHETALSTGPISITGNIGAGNVSVGGGVYFPDGTVQTTAAIAASTGNITFTGDTIGSVENGDRGITINASGYGEVVVSDNLGINNVNPAYALDIGNINENENTGAIGINFNNNVESVGHRYGSALVGWDWWDQNGHGTNNDGTEHYRFGIYNGNVAPFSHAWLSFDKDAPADSIVVDSVGTVTVNKMVSNSIKSNVQVRHTEVESDTPLAVEPIDVITGVQWIHTANTTQNFVFNVRGNSSTTLDTFLGNGETVTLQYTVTNGSTAYYCTGVQVDGVARTVKWLQGSAPSAGTVDGYDLYNFFLTKISANTYVILGQQQKYS